MLPFKKRRSLKTTCTISAQDLLLNIHADGMHGFLRERTFSKMFRTAKWTLRFVVLAHNAIYVYNDENSKSPIASIPLCDYISVTREESPSCNFAFTLQPRDTSRINRKGCFGCVNDAERLEWMKCVKDRLYIANNVTQRKDSISEELADKFNLSISQRELTEEKYLRLELPVLSSDETRGDNVNTRSSKHEYESGSDTSSEKSFGYSKLERNDFDDDVVDDDTKQYHDVNEFAQSIISSPLDLASDDWCNANTNIESSGTAAANDLDPGENQTPPRYSAVCAPRQSPDKSDYENSNALSRRVREQSLEAACTVQDQKLMWDREACINMLARTKRLGTYLIRKSRSDPLHRRILSILYQDNLVREHVILVNGDTFCLVKGEEFSSMESLLAYYTDQKPVPTIGLYLGSGVYEKTGYENLNERKDDGEHVYEREIDSETFCKQKLEEDNFNKLKDDDGDDDGVDDGVEYLNEQNHDCENLYELADDDEHFNKQGEDENEHLYEGTEPVYKNCL